MDVHLPQYALLASIVPSIAPTVACIIRARDRTLGSMFTDKRATSEVALLGLFVECYTPFLVVVIHGRGGEEETPSEGQWGSVL